MDSYTTTPDPLRPSGGEEIRIDGKIVGRIRRTSKGSYIGTTTWSNLSVVPDIVTLHPRRRPTRSEAIGYVLEQARRDLRDKKREEEGR